MTRAARIYDFTLPAGAARELLVEGSYYRILTAAGAMEVRRDGGSALGPIFPGQGERAQFKRLTLVDKSGSNNAGLIVVGDDTFIDDRITGEVSVIDGGRSRTLANLAFSARMLCAPVAGQYTHLQLWNPSTNRNVIVKQFSLSAPVVSSVYLMFNATALGVQDSTEPNPVSKLTTGARSMAHIRTLNQASVATTTAYVGVYQCQPYDTKAFQLTEPIVVAPQTGLFFFATPVGYELAATVDLYEEAI